MKTITYNPETQVLVPREPSQDMIDAMPPVEEIGYWAMYEAAIAAAPQPEQVDVGSVGWKHDCAALCANDIELWIDRCPHCGKPRHNHPPTDDELLNKAEQVESEPFGYYENGRFSVITDGGPDKYRERKGYQGAIYTTPQPDRTAELEAALKVARDGIDKFLVANDPTEFGCACDLSVGYLCGPCHADKLRAELAAKDEVIAEAGEMLAMRDRQLAALKAELHEICSAINDPACDLTLTTVECIKKLKAENESLKRDAERLDWVEHQDFYDLSFSILVNQPNDGMTAVSIGEGWHLGNNLREAIDAAMIAGDKNVLD